MRINAVVELNHYEQELCVHVAKMRNHQNACKYGYNPFRELVNDINGVGAEWAFCSLFNVSHRGIMDIHPRSARKGEDNLGDATILENIRIDVKCTSKEDGKLVVSNTKINQEVHAYALMSGVFPVYTFRGFVPKEYVFRECNESKKGKKNYHSVYQYELLEIEGLKKHLSLIVTTREATIQAPQIKAN